MLVEPSVSSSSEFRLSLLLPLLLLLSSLSSLLFSSLSSISPRASPKQKHPEPVQAESSHPLQLLKPPPIFVLAAGFLPRQGNGRARQRKGKAKEGKTGPGRASQVPKLRQAQVARQRLGQFRLIQSSDFLLFNAWICPCFILVLLSIVDAGHSRLKAHYPTAQT